jgi:hypothetical protein
VVDLPGVGKSFFFHPDDYQRHNLRRPVTELTVDLAEQEFTASEKFPLPGGQFAWSTAMEHNQWPGVGLHLCQTLLQRFESREANRMSLVWSPRRCGLRVVNELYHSHASSKAHP